MHIAIHLQNMTESSGHRIWHNK